MYMYDAAMSVVSRLAVKEGSVASLAFLNRIIRQVGQLFIRMNKFTVFMFRDDNNQCCQPNLL